MDIFVVDEGWIVDDIVGLWLCWLVWVCKICGGWF